jgi:hypothetical protein
MDFLVADGYMGNVPIMLAGHSYGGAVALIIAARLRFSSSTVQIRYLTYGCPKIGDERLIRLLQLCEGFDIANDGDVVTILPPDLRTVTPVELIVGLPSLLRYVAWERPPHQMLMRDDGTIAPRLATLIDTTTLLFMVQKVIALLPLEVISAHFIGTYIQRLALRCSLPFIPAGTIVLGTVVVRPKTLGTVVLDKGPVRPKTGETIVLDVRPIHCEQAGVVVDAPVIKEGETKTGIFTGAESWYFQFEVIEGAVYSISYDHGAVVPPNQFIMTLLVSKGYCDFITMFSDSLPVVGSFTAPFDGNGLITLGGTVVPGFSTPWSLTYIAAGP